MASSSSHRQRGRPLILATKPRRMTSFTKSCRVKRERGWPLSLGSSQAMALTCITSSGGKTGRAPRTRQVFQAFQAFLEKSLSPFAHDLARQGNAQGDLIIAQPLRRHQNDLGPHDVKVR